MTSKNIRNLSLATQNQSFRLVNRLVALVLMTSIDGCYREHHQQVAAYFGVTYRHLLYVIANFVHRGLLIKDGNKYWIHDLQGIKELASPVLKSIPLTNESLL